MTLVERFRGSALLLVIVAMVAFCVALRSMGLLLVTLPLAVLSWYVTEGPRGKALPRWVQNALLLLLLAWVGFEATRLPELADSMGLLGRFVQWLLLIKLFGRKRRADYQQIIALTAVLVMAGTLQSPEFTFAIVVFIYAGLALWTVLLYQLWAARERAREQRALAMEVARTRLGPESSVNLAPPVQPVFGRSVGWHFRSMLVVSTVLGIVLSVVVFLIFPRELGELSRRDARTGSAQVGFSDEVQLLTNGRITDNQREVFSVKWIEANRGDRVRFGEPLYLRGGVLPRYRPDDGRWRSARRVNASPVTVNTTKGEFRPLTRKPIDERIQTYIQEVEMRSLATDIVFSSWAPIAILSDEERSFELQRSSLILRERQGSVGRSYRYAIKVQPFASEATLEALVEEAPPVDHGITFPVRSIVDFSDQLALQLRLPPRIESIETPEMLERHWQRSRQVARGLTAWLQSSEFSYTTDLTNFARIDGEDPIYSFVARYRFGHCEHFASALVAMCQALGVEARVVTGYLAIEFDETMQEYVVRQSNAHAWAEIRVGVYQWMRLDPTPSDTLAELQERRRSWADSLRWFYDRIEFLWNSQVATFDSGTQAALAERASQAWQRMFKGWMDLARTQLKRLNDYFVFEQVGTYWLGLVGFALVLAVLAVGSVQRRRRRLERVTGLHLKDPKARQLLRQLGFWLDALDALERRGHAKPAWRTPREHVLALRTSDPAAATAFAQLVDLYYRVRFAGESLEASEHRAAESLIRELRQ